MKKNVLIGIVAIIALGVIAQVYSFYRFTSMPGILRPGNAEKEHYLVAHALGNIDGVTGTNSREAFLAEYEKGIRIFEVDLSLTKDGAVVAFHDGAEEKIGITNKKIGEITHEEFMSQKFLDKYTLLDIHNLLQLLREYPDVYLITDAKDDFVQTHKRIVGAVLSVSHEAVEDYRVLDRIIPQIYQTEQLHTLNTIYQFPDIIFTLYRTPISDRDLLSFLLDNREVTAVAMWWDRRYNDRLHSELENLNVGTFVHTLDDPETVESFLKKRVGVYRDMYLPYNDLSITKYKPNFWPGIF